MPKTIKKRTNEARRASGDPQLKGLFDSVMNYTEEHGKRIVPAVVAVVAIAVIALGIWAIQSYRDRAASAKLAEAMEFYSPNPGIPPDYAKALEMFRKAGNDYGSTLNGAIAEYYAANSLMHLGRTDEALKAYQAFVDDYSGRTFLSGLAYQRLGYALLSRGNQAEAAKAFEQAEQRLGPGLATVELARLYEQMGDSAQSQEKYQTISTSLAGTQWAFEAMRKLPPPAAPPAPAAPQGKNTQK